MKLIFSIFLIFFITCVVALSTRIPPRNETLDQTRERVVARDNPKLIPDPLIHPDINKQWIIQYNPNTKRYRAFWLFTHSELYGEFDTHKEAADHLNEIHLKNKGATPWEPATLESQQLTERISKLE